MFLHHFLRSRAKLDQLVLQKILEMVLSICPDFLRRKSVFLSICFFINLYLYFDFHY